MTLAEIRRAAKVLRREAAAIKDSHTFHGLWAGDDFAKADHDEMIDLARGLEAMAHPINSVQPCGPEAD